ncbi:MAG: hypothetical protein GY853_03900 [PVC group bacterium]|nr:hypothetical protein [PVC group bacterium]
MIRKNIIFLILICVFANIVFADQDYYSFSAISAKGWEREVIDSKEVITVDSSLETGYIDLDVPQDGNYQLYISLFHEWREYTPFIYFEVVDCKKKRYSGYLFSEPRWYFLPGEGRWEIRASSADPFWFLHKGKLKVKFWVGARNSCWDNKETGIEGKVAIDRFMLIPVNMHNKEQLSPEA